MKKAIVIGALLLGCAAVFWAVTPKQEDRLNMEEQEKQIVTPNTDLARLAEITTVVGQPAVLWARIPMGRIDQTGRLPGPTDLGLIAVLDYGTASAAETALGGAKGVHRNWILRKNLSGIIGFRRLSSIRSQTGRSRW